jgi:hypothetical protein
MDCLNPWKENVDQIRGFRNPPLFSTLLAHYNEAAPGGTGWGVVELTGCLSRYVTLRPAPCTVTDTGRPAER